jgi:hypothetical protein
MPAQNQLPAGWSTLPPGWSAAPPAGATSAGGTSTGGDSEPGLLDKINSTFANNPGAGQPGGYDEALRPIGNIGRRAVRDVAGQVAEFGHKITTPSEWGFRLSPDDARPQNPDLIDQIKDYGHTAKSQGIMQAGSDLAGDALAAYAGYKGGEAVAGVPSAAKRFLRGPVDEPMAGTDVTPRQRYDSAKRVGVNLPPAQATNSPILKPLDWINQEGLLSGGLHEKLRGQNTNALTGATDELLGRMSPFDPETGGTVVRDRLKSPFVDLQNEAHETLEGMSPLGREQGGTRLQSLLKDNQEKLHSEGTAEQTAVRDMEGDNLLQSLDPMRSTAKTIKDSNADFDEISPSTVPKHLRGMVNDVARLGEEIPEGRTAPLPVTIGKAMKFRTEHLNALDKNPELVSPNSLRDIENLVKAEHESILNSLSPEAQQRWLKGNEIWKDMKDTYDNPSSPFYNAVRTPNPSTLVEGIGGTSPEAVRALRTRSGPEGVGIVGRGVGEKLLGKNERGEYDLKNFGSRLERMPEDSRNELFGADHHEQLRGIGSRYRELQPFEDAAYTSDPESLVKGIGPKTAAGVRQLRDIPVKPEGAEGPPAPRIGPSGMGAVQRGVAEDLLGTTNTGGYNFPTFPGRMERMNPGYRAELFGPHQAELEDIGRTAHALDVNYNRSGSGKQAQKFIEAGTLMSGVPLLQYPLGKVMTSPAVSDWLMRDGRPNPVFARAAGVATATAPKRRSRPGYDEHEIDPGVTVQKPKRRSSPFER